MPLENAHFFAWNLPKGCESKLETFVNDGHRILCVAFPPDRAEAWTIITDKSFANHNIPSECDQRMRQLRNDGHKVVAVGFPHDRTNAWSIITDKGFANSNLPIGCDAVMRKLEADGERVTWVAFPPGNIHAWSIITSKGFVNMMIPGECDSKMKELEAKGERVTAVSFPEAGGNRWTVITNSGMFNRAVSPRCHRTMRAFRGIGAFPLACVAHAPDGGFVVVGSAAPFRAAHAPLDFKGKRFSLDAMMSEVVAQLEGNTAKYGVMLRYGNAVRTACSGPARTAFTPPARDFTVFDWFNPASVTKTITSVALLQLLAARKLGIGERIARHLPPSWQIGPNVETITMAELLNHTSGFRGGALRYHDLREMVQQGVSLADKAGPDGYCNCNSALARIIIAYLDGHEQNIIRDDVETNARFIAVVQKNIFDRLGIPDVGWKPDEDAPTLFFPNPPLASTGTAYGDYTEQPGSAGSHLSLAELGHFLRALRTSELLISSQDRMRLDQHQLGLARSDVDAGYCMRKRGFFPAGRNNGATLNSGIWWFSTGVQAVAVSNGSGVDMNRAYNRAWSKI